jgi:acyl carrier protein
MGQAEERMVAGMTLAKVIELVEEASQSLPGTVHEHTELGTDGVWDSLSMVMFMGLVEEEIGIELTAEDMESSLTPRDLTDAIARRTGR